MRVERAAVLVEVAYSLSHLGAACRLGASRVRAGQGVLVLEAMRMQNEIQAKHEGTIRRVS